MFAYIECRKCGGVNRPRKYVQFIKCYACGERIILDDKEKERLRKAFSNGIPRKPQESLFEKQLFQSLGLSEDQRKYIEVDEKSVIFRFPLKAAIDFSVGGKRLYLDYDTKNYLYEYITKFWEDMLYKGGFEIQIMVGELGEVDYYKGVSNEEEAKEAVKWLVEFKKRFEF